MSNASVTSISGGSLDPLEASRRLARLERAGVAADEEVLAFLRQHSPSEAQNHRGNPALWDGYRRWSQGRVQQLLLAGPTGIGKTWVGLWVTTVMGGGWMHADEVQSGWDKRRRLEAALLVVDDLGVEPAGWKRSDLGSLLCRRYDLGLRTVVTTNLPLQTSRPGADTIESLYGKRVSSRLGATGRSVVVHAGGGDLRAGATP